MKTYGSLFTGFGGACLGARAAGLELAWGNELDPAIAEVGNFNLGGHIRVGDVLEQNPMHYDRVDVLHMSPPCTRASVANSSAEVNEDGLKESALDIALANKCIEFVETLQPENVTLENVWAYRKFQSWQGGRKCEGIQSALHRLGYWVSVEHVNSADMGVAQTRKRMIVRAIRGGFVPYLPPPVKWVGWYEAIEDILHTLPDSKFAPWQLARLPEEIKQTLMLWNMDQTARDVTVRYADQPVPTVDTGMMRRPSSVPQAILMDSKNVNQEYGKLYRNSDEPAITVTTDGKPSHMPRALLISNAKTEFSDGTRHGDDPAFTVTGESNGRVKAFLVGKHYDAPSGASERYVQVKAPSEPSMTVTSSDKIECRGLYGGRVVAITPQALARFQSFPDGTPYPGSVRLSKPYILPESKTLAAKGLGNAVCPLVSQIIYEGLKGI